MAFDIQTEIIIQANISLVWKVFIDFTQYPKWNPFIETLEGEVAVDNKIKVRLTPPGAKAMNFTPTVLTFENEKSFSWQGHLFFPGVFDGKHVFALEDLGNNTVRFTQSESFKGILLPFLKKMLNTTTIQGFNAMNEA